jgi:hypothetical protein
MLMLQRRCLASFVLVAFVLYMDTCIFSSFVGFTKQLILSPSSLQPWNGTTEAGTTNTTNTAAVATVNVTAAALRSESQRPLVRRRLQQRQRLDTIASLHEASLQLLNTGRLPPFRPTVGTKDTNIGKLRFSTLPSPEILFNQDSQQLHDYTNVFVAASVSSFAMVITVCLLRILCCRGTKTSHQEQQPKEPVECCSCCCSRYISSSCFCWSALEEEGDTKSSMFYHKMIEDGSERDDGSFFVLNRGRKPERRSRSRSRSRSNSSRRRSPSVVSTSLPLSLSDSSVMATKMASISSVSASPATSVMGWMRTSTYSPFDKQSDRSRRRSNSVRRYLRKARDSLYGSSQNRNNNNDDDSTSTSQETLDTEQK